MHDIPKKGANPLASFVIKNFAPVDYPVGLHWHHFNRPILPPIVPYKIGNGRQQIDNKILVYLPFEQLVDILSLLRPFQGYEFSIYHGVPQADDNDHIHLRPYSRTGFLDDLIECNGVISNAGFELASEALSLGKKILVKPLSGQMEQLSNALALTSLNLGMTMEKLDGDGVAQFLDRPSASRLKIPDVARLVAEWIEGGQWEDVEGLARKAWQQASEVRVMRSED
ncbi:Glycosyltransferase [Olavius algarvensis Delta 1 endosymbiont]|nr:Glycosyltransferase [Olavius algarvensis Delta 1 endosymbiont]